MKISRWMLIKALRKRVMKSLFYIWSLLSLIGAGVWGIHKIVEMEMQGRNVIRLLDFKDNWWIFIVIGGPLLLIIYSLYTEIEKGLLLDILLLQVEKLPEVSRSTIRFPAKMKRYDWSFAPVYQIEIPSGKKEPLQLDVNKNFCEIPNGAKYNIYYLKDSKIIVNVEVLEGEKKSKRKKVILMDPPVIPQYSTEELKAKTRIHSGRSKVVLACCIGGLILLGVWGMYSWENYLFGYLWERERCIGMWICLLLLELLFIVLFCQVDRGCFRDIYSGEICVTEMIPITEIYGKHFLCDIDGAIRNKVCGIELEVTEGIHKKKRFLLYKNISDYWNCFSVFEHKPRHRRLQSPKYEVGEHELEAVRIYYLKHSGIVVKLDVKT